MHLCTTNYLLVLIADLFWWCFILGRCSFMSATKSVLICGPRLLALLHSTASLEMKNVTALNLSNYTAGIKVDQYQSHFPFLGYRPLFGRGQILVLPGVIDGFIFIECQYVCRKMRSLFLIVKNKALWIFQIFCYGSKYLRGFYAPTWLSKSDAVQKSGN